MHPVDAILRPWWDRLRADLRENLGAPPDGPFRAERCPVGHPLELFDAHTHIGNSDPDGARQTPEQLLAALEPVPARAVVFAMHEPDGYPPANDRALEAAASSNGRLVAFCRLDPRQDPLTEARRCLDAGAAGIKLHPRAERFTLSEAAVREIVALAHERRVPVLIHAGRGIPALGQDTVRLSGEFPDARLILAHAAISDLAWLWRVLPEHPNLFVDTAWWDPADLIAMFALCPPGNLLWASDSPYGRPLVSAALHLRLALQAGLGHDAVRVIAGAQLQRILDGGEPIDAGPPPGNTAPLDLLLERTVSHLNQAIARSFDHGDPEEPVALARLACAVGEEGPHAELFAAILGLLDRYEAMLDPPPPGERYPDGVRVLVAATTIARTPDVPLPELPGAPPPTRAEAEA